MGRQAEPGSRPAGAGRSEPRGRVCDASRRGWVVRWSVYTRRRSRSSASVKRGLSSGRVGIGRSTAKERSGPEDSRFLSCLAAQAGCRGEGKQTGAAQRRGEKAHEEDKGRKKREETKVVAGASHRRGGGRGEEGGGRGGGAENVERRCGGRMKRAKGDRGGRRAEQCSLGNRASVRVPRRDGGARGSR